jgi:ABC-type transport system involved in multi-copper enzyme maturation permease subunit
MRWLLWKDYRQNRLVVFTALGLLLAPHLVALYATCRTKSVATYSVRRDWDAFRVVAFFSLWVSQGALVLIGANAIGSERVDRSSEFLFSLPITRRRLLASKLLLALGTAAVPWLVNAPMAWDVFEEIPGGASDQFANIGITGTTFFCVAWFLSSFLAGPAYAVYGGIVTPLCVIGGIRYVDYLFDLQISGDSAGLWYRAICLALAVPCFVVGTWHYLRRVEP